MSLILLFLLLLLLLLYFSLVRYNEQSHKTFIHIILNKRKDRKSKACLRNEIQK